MSRFKWAHDEEWCDSDFDDTIQTNMNRFDSDTTQKVVNCFIGSQRPLQFIYMWIDSVTQNMKFDTNESKTMRHRVLFYCNLILQFFFFCGFWLLSNDSCNMSNITAWKYFFGLVYYLCWVWLIDRHKRDANSEIIGYWAEFDCNVIVNLQFIWQTNEMYLDKTKHIDVRYITR